MVKKEQSVQPPSFETAVAELESIVSAMERNDLPLEEALAAYQRGISLLRHCQGTLNTAEQRVQILEQGLLQDLHTDPDGQES